MKKIYTLLFATSAALAMTAPAVAGNITPEKERAAKHQLRFRHSRPQPEGLYGVPQQKKTCRVPSLKSTTGRPELVANCTSSKIGHGMYSFFAEPNLKIEKIAETPAFFGGAIYVNGKYYAADYDYNANNELDYVAWYVYDATTWRLEKTVSNPLDWSYIATDRTYDSTTGKVYSITYDKAGNAIQLSTTSLTDGASTLVGPLEKDVIMIAASPEGQLYGIDIQGKLYKINKKNAKLSLVGSTNIYDDYESPYTQTITFDPESKKILWAEFHSEGLFTSSAALFEVDPATASARKIADIPGGPEMIGMYVTDYMQAGVPAAATGLEAVPTAPGSTNVAFRFNAPSRTTDGSAISEPMMIEISVDGDLLDIQEAAGGAKVETQAFSLTRGLHTVKVVAENGVGSGEVAALVFYAGYDVPAAPVVTMKYESGKAIVTWTAPTEGSEGGLIRGPFTYDVVRMPGNVKVAEGISATTFTEPLEQAASYSYIVTPISPDGRGLAGESNSIVGGSCQVPFITSFDTEEEFKLWTIVDVTSGGKVWNYDEDNHRLRHPWSMDNEIDDYIISPGLKMDGSKTYTVSFDANQFVGSYDEHVMLYFGPSQDVNTMKLITDTGKLPEVLTNYSGTVAPTESGIWYIAFRSKTGKNGFMSYVDNVRVLEKGTSEVADKVENFTAAAADGGELKVAISFNAPKTTMGGQSLASISYINLLRGEGSEPVKTFENPAPGELLTWTDTSVKSGINTYRAIVYTAAGAGEQAMARVFAGVDVPEMPSNLIVSGQAGSRSLKWDAPTQGVNGGNLAGVVSYKVERVVNDQSEVVVEDLVDTAYTDTWTTEEQAFVYYSVRAVTTAGESNALTSRSFAVGEAYKLPYNESFAEGAPQTKPWSVEQVAGAQGSWTIKAGGEDPYVSPQDKDGGLAEFDGYHGWTDGCELRLISPTISIKSHKDIVLSFYLYHYNGIAGWWQSEPDPVGETLKVEISQDGAPFVAIPEGEYTLYAPTSGWVKYELPLDSFRNCEGVRIAFHGRGAGNFNIHIDNISIDGEEDFSAIGEMEAKGLTVESFRGEILVKGLTGKAHIYDASGREVAQLTGAGYVALPAGIYAVVCGKEVCKVLVK